MKSISKSMASAALIALAVSAVCGCSSSKYVQRNGDNGWMFHVFSQKMPALTKGSKAIDYDYTYLQQTDSVALLATIVIPGSAKATAANILTCDTDSSYPVELIYMKPKGKDYVYRLRSTIPFSQLTDMYNCDKPFAITYTFAAADGDKTYSYGYSYGKWQKKKDEMLPIISTIIFNVGK